MIKRMYLTLILLLFVINIYAAKFTGVIEYEGTIKKIKKLNNDKYSRIWSDNFDIIIIGQDFPFGLKGFKFFILKTKSKEKFACIPFIKTCAKIETFGTDW